MDEEKMTGLKLFAGLVERLQRLAKKMDCSPMQAARAALLQGLAHLEKSGGQS